MASLRVATTCSVGRRASGRPRQQQVVDRAVVDGDPHAPQVVEAARIAGQARPHHDDLRQRPGLVEQLVTGGALVRVRQEHHVGLAGVELGHALVAQAEANLDREAGLARQRADQLDVEALGLAVLVEVFVGGKLAVAAVDDGPGLHLRALRYGGQPSGSVRSRRGERAAMPANAIESRRGITADCNRAANAAPPLRQTSATRFDRIEVRPHSKGSATCLMPSPAAAGFPVPRTTPT